MDALAPFSEIGLAKTVPCGMSPGSDVANLSVVGYDPKVYYTGRSPLEAANMGIDLGDNDIAMRANLVTLSDEENFADKTMVDYCAGDISTAEAKELIAAVQEAMGNDIYSFYPGVSYRHCLVWKDGTVDIGTLTPPHDISGKVIGPHLNDNPLAKDLIAMMEKSNEILKDHPVNIKRIEKGKRPATHIWLWGQGSRPKLADFKENMLLVQFVNKVSAMTDYQFELLKDFSNQWQDTIQIVTIATKESFDDFEKLFEEKNYKWKLLNLENEILLLEKYQIKTYPDYVIIGTNGKIGMSPAPSPEQYLDFHVRRLYKYYKK
jgi:hypothetical protein